jgi:hypothetical protein
VRRLLTHNATRLGISSSLRRGGIRSVQRPPTAPLQNCKDGRSHARPRPAALGSPTRGELVGQADAGLTDARAQEQGRARVQRLAPCLGRVPEAPPTPLIPSDPMETASRPPATETATRSHRARFASARVACARRKEPLANSFLCTRLDRVLIRTAQRNQPGKPEAFGSTCDRPIHPPRLTRLSLGRARLRRTATRRSSQIGKAS